MFYLHYFMMIVFVIPKDLMQLFIFDLTKCEK